MSSYEPKVNSGTLWVNDRKEKGTHPDFKGRITLEDGTHWLSAWKKEKNGQKFLSISVGALKDGQPPRQSAPATDPADVGDPFS